MSVLRKTSFFIQTLMQKPEDTWKERILKNDAEGRHEISCYMRIKCEKKNRIVRKDIG